MAIVYKIHPAIGIARVGDHPDAFFIGPELAFPSEAKSAAGLTGTSPVELDGLGNDVPFTTYKKAGQIRRQGARFRVFAYDQGAGGALSNAREVASGDNFEITWTVELCNRKAAWDKSIARPGPRNADVTARGKLVVGPIALSISGVRQTSQPFRSQFFGHAAQAKQVELGILKTDAGGRLIVLGGFGRAFNDGTNGQLASGTFGDRDGWTDDVSDGAVSATIKVNGQSAAAVAARVIIAPPDFAPGIGQPVTLYDTVRQVAASFGVPDPVRPSFTRDVLPILTRCVNLRWTNGQSLWGKLRKDMQDDWARLSNNTDAQTADIRQKVATTLSKKLPLRYTELPNVTMLELTPIQKKILDLWAVGTFERDWDQQLMPSISNPADLDRGPLECAVGGGFFPGIEAGDRMTDKNVYLEPFRLKPDLAPGFFTEQMAVPWHSDFYDCAGNWWPSQRPDLAPQKNDPDGFFPDWTDGLVVQVMDMVRNFPQLGYIKSMNVQGKQIYAEDERNQPRA